MKEFEPISPEIDPELVERFKRRCYELTKNHAPDTLEGDPLGTTTVLFLIGQSLISIETFQDLSFTPFDVELQIYDIQKTTLLADGTEANTCRIYRHNHWPHPHMSRDEEILVKDPRTGHSVDIHSLQRKEMWRSEPDEDIKWKRMKQMIDDTQAEKRLRGIYDLSSQEVEKILHILDQLNDELVISNPETYTPIYIGENNE